MWSNRLQEVGAHKLVYRGTNKADAENVASLLSGSAVKLRRLEIEESRDIARYHERLVNLGDAPSRYLAGGDRG